MKITIDPNFDEMTNDDYLNDDVYNIDPDWDAWDGWEYADSLIENLTKDPESIEIPTEYLDQIVEFDDYLSLNDYLERIPEVMKQKVMEYIEFNHPEFFEDVKVANNERFVKQNTKTGQQISKNFDAGKWKNLNPSYKASKKIIEWYESNLLANLN